MTGRAVLWLLATSPAAAQGPDSLLSLGRIAAAESAYYAASSARPRDPMPRARLGVFLARRGGTRAGAVLLEEARQFGADSLTIARALTPLYVRLGDYRALIALKPSVLTAEEQLRAKYLAENPTKVVFRDSVMRLSYRPTRTAGFGTVLLRVGRAELAAVIDPGLSGLSVPASLAPDLQMFGDEAGVATVRIGNLAFENAPLTLADSGQPTRVGFDVLQLYSPTFDPRAGTITLHRPARVWRPGNGTRVPALYDASGMRLLLGAGWTSATAPNVALLLASRAWTWDARRGDVILLTP